MDVSIEELQALCNEVDRIYHILQEDYDNADIEPLRLKALSFWRELKFFLDSRETL